MFSRYCLAIRAFHSSTAAAHKVGFFGLGNMGLPMACNLKKAGFEVTGYDINKDAIKMAQENGITIAETITEAAKDKTFIVTSLPATKHVEDTLMKEGGIFKSAAKGTLICDVSTINPHASIKFAQEAQKFDMVFMDTPMSGGIVGAKNGTLTFMVGGSIENFEKAKVLLQGMGKNFFHCGGPGTGEIAKLTNNLILGISMVATAEGMAIGEKLGIDPKVLKDILSVSTARNWCIDTYNPRPGNIPGTPASRNYEGGFMVELIRKDLALALEAIQDTGAKSDMTEKSLEYYRAIEKKGFGRKDFGIVY